MLETKRLHPSADFLSRPINATIQPVYIALKYNFLIKCVWFVAA